jgi:hypothetical protein
MKIKLIFDSKDPDDMEDYKLKLEAKRMHCAIHDIKQKVRALDRYENKFKNVDEAVEGIYQSICDILIDYNLRDF